MSSGELDLKIIPASWQICAMCHASGECPECPERCRCEKRECLNNGCQTCVQKLIRRGEISFEDEAERLEAWLHLVTNENSMRNLKKYFKQ